MGDIGKSTGGRVVVVVHHQTSGRNVEVDGMHERTGRETMTFRHHEQLLLASPTMVRTIRFRPLLTSDAPARPERYRLVASPAALTPMPTAFDDLGAWTVGRNQPPTG